MLRAHGLSFRCAAGESQPVSPAQMPAVRFWSKVEVWSDGPPRIRLSGVALESAAVGKAVRVRAGLGWRPLEGIVRGPHSVELVGKVSDGKEP